MIPESDPAGEGLPRRRVVGGTTPPRTTPSVASRAAPAAAVEDNPYAAPSAELRVRRRSAQGAPKASRAIRLAARVADQVAYVPGAVLAMMGTEGLFSWQIGFGIGVPLLLVVLGFNAYYLFTAGQTVGKKACRIRIVRADGSRASFGRILGLRICLPLCCQMVPCLGALFFLADPLFIFGQSRRCIHDHMADTIVVEA